MRAIIAAAALLLPLSASAGLITFEATSHVISDVNGPLIHAKEFRLRYIYDTSTPDLHPDDPQLGLYENPLVSVSLWIDGFEHQSNHDLASSVRVVQTDDMTTFGMTASRVTGKGVSFGVSLSTLTYDPPEIFIPLFGGLDTLPTDISYVPFETLIWIYDPMFRDTYGIAFVDRWYVVPEPLSAVLMLGGLASAMVARRIKPR